jgi:hypothetical protein
MSIVTEDYCACGVKFTESNPDCVFNYHSKPKESTPNINLVCSICNEQITSVCMLSPNWSVCNQLTVAIITLRQHLKDKHQIKQPMEIQT